MNENESKNCPKCGEEIKASAKKCKHCQADLRNWFIKHKIITGILIIIIIAVIGNLGNNEDQKTNTPAPAEEVAKVQKEVVTPEKSTPEIIITSAEIAKEYSENEVAADEKYKGKLIEISGKISNIDNGSFDNEMIVKLSDGEYDFSGPMCYMKASEKEKILTFKKDQQVTLIGTGNSATIGSPMLKDCVVK